MCSASQLCKSALPSPVFSSTRSTRVGPQKDAVQPEPALHQAAQHPIPVHLRQHVLLENHRVSALGGRVHEFGVAALHLVVVHELGQDHGLAAGDQRAGAVAVVLGAHGFAEHLRDQVGRHHGRLLADRRASLGVAWQPRRVPKGKNVGKTRALQGVLVHFDPAGQRPLTRDHVTALEEIWAAHVGNHVHQVVLFAEGLGAAALQSALKGGRAGHRLDVGEGVLQPQVDVARLDYFHQRVAVLLYPEDHSAGGIKLDLRPAANSIFAEGFFGQVHDLLGCSAALDGGRRPVENRVAAPETANHLPGALSLVVVVN